MEELVKIIFVCFLSDIIYVQVCVCVCVSIYPQDLLTLRQTGLNEMSVCLCMCVCLLDTVCVGGGGTILKCTPV